MDIKALNIGDLAVPITKLIETIDKACGGIFKPFQIKRIAKAEADAKIVIARAQTEVEAISAGIVPNEIMNRQQFLEFRRLKNISDISSKTYLELLEKNQIQEEPVDEDWAVEFFNKAQDISNEDMQNIWAKILAGEISKPGSFSYRTLNFVKSLNKHEAHLITNVCKYIFLHTLTLKYWFFDETINDHMRQQGIYDESITHLQNIGFFSPTINLQTMEMDKVIGIGYCGKQSYYKIQTGNFHLMEPKILTDIGEELLPISGAICEPEYRNEIEKILIEKDATEITEEEFINSFKTNKKSKD